MPKGIYERTTETKTKLTANMRAANRRRQVEPAARAEAAEVARRNWAVWRKANPDVAAEACSTSGLISSAITYRCHECNRVITGPSMFKHQRAQDHEGLTILTDKEPQ